VDDNRLVPLSTSIWKPAGQGTRATGHGKLIKRRHAVGDNRLVPRSTSIWKPGGQGTRATGHGKLRDAMLWAIIG
jgi:hypothetical protein